MSFEPGRRRFEEYPHALDIEADVCVIGAGAGGCAAACALAEAGLRVAVVEEGRHWSARQFQPKDPPWALQHMYQEKGSRAAFGNGVILVNGGRGVGGSTLLNSAICFKTPRVILEDWAGRGLPTLEPERFEPLLDRVWNTIGVVKNPVSIQRTNNLIFKQGAEALGLKGDFLWRNAPGCVGCGVCQLGCPSGGKNSVDRTFLGLALASGRCAVYADCRVEIAETDGDSVVAVGGSTLDPDGYQPAGSFRVRAKQFLVAGGPVGSPRFLMKNGLSTSDHLGQHLHLHPALGFIGHFQHDIVPWDGVSQGYYVDRWERGYLLQTATAPPDQLFAVMPLKLGPEIMGVMGEARQLALAGVLVHDEDSVGSVNELAMLYHLGGMDRQRLLLGVREGLRVYFAAGADYVVPAIAGVGIIRDPDEIDARIPLDIPAREIVGIASHPMGTCRMAASVDEGVVDPEGRVFGWDNLFVADASTFPSSLGVNPQVTVMAMGLMVGGGMAVRA